MPLSILSSATCLTATQRPGIAATELVAEVQEASFSLRVTLLEAILFYIFMAYFYFEKLPVPMYRPTRVKNI